MLFAVWDQCFEFAVVWVTEKASGSYKPVPHIPEFSSLKVVSK